MNENELRMFAETIEAESGVLPETIAMIDAADEITKLREQVAAQAAVIESLKRAIGAWDRAETPSELQSAEAGLLKSLSIPTDSTTSPLEIEL